MYGSLVVARGISASKSFLFQLDILFLRRMAWSECRARCLSFEGTNAGARIQVDTLFATSALNEVFYFSRPITIAQTAHTHKLVVDEMY